MIPLPDTKNHGLRAWVGRLPILLLSQIFVASVGISLLALDAFKTWDAYQARERESRLFSENLARSIAQNAEDTIKQADTVLVGVLERLEKDGMKPDKMERLRKMLVLHVSELPKLHGLFVYDETGRWLATNRNMVPSANNADREYFIYHKTHPDRTVYIAKPLHSRSTGDWILPVSRRINHPDGSFAGVVLATIHLKYFRDFYDTFNIGKEGAIALVHMNGNILMQRPFQDERIGMSLKESALYRDYLPNKQSGTYWSDKTSFDDNQRIVSFYRIEHYPLVVLATMSADELFRMWWIDTGKRFAITLILLVVLGLMGSGLVRQIRHRLTVENRLRETQVKLESLNVELEQMAWQDGLTGLANRRRFDVALNEEFNRAMRQEEPLALILIDIDHFKRFNDCYGHIEGDKCLRGIGQIVKSIIKRAGDLVVRYGGEELVVVLPNTDLPGATLVAERLLTVVREMAIPHKGSAAGIVTISCGVHAMIPKRGQHIPSDLLKIADAALYEAKSAGRNQVVSRA